MQTPLGSRCKYSYPSCYFTCQIQTHVWTGSLLFCFKMSSKNKLQNIDIKSVKLALWIPVHASTVSYCREAGIVPLEEFRKLALAKYFVRASSVENFTKEDLDDLTLTFRIELRRAHSLQLLLHLPPTWLKIIILFPEMSIRVLSLLLLRLRNIYQLNDTYYSSIRKEDTPNLLTNIVRSHIADNYPNHLKVNTDSSV